MVVDDMPVVRTLARAYLEEAGFAVVEAEDGAAALARCGTAMPDAILLDREMPRMDGERFLAALRRHPGGGAPKVLLCTGSRPVDGEAYARDLGADELVDKPFDREHLMTKLIRLGFPEAKIGLFRQGTASIDLPGIETPNQRAGETPAATRGGARASILGGFIADEGGATAIEYGMIAALIAVAVIGTLKVVGTQLDAKFGVIAAQLN